MLLDWKEGKMESLSCFSHLASAKDYPRGPRAGFQQPQHSGSRAENGVIWAKTPEKPQDCHFLLWLLHPGISKKSCDAGNRGFKAPFHVQAVSDLANKHINRKQRWVAGHIQKCPRTLDFNEDFSLHTLFLPGPCAI